MCIQFRIQSHGWHETSWWRHHMDTFSVLLAICEPVNSPHKGQWRGALMFSFICVWINGWLSNREAGDLRRYRAHYDVTVMMKLVPLLCKLNLCCDTVSFLTLCQQYVAGGNQRYQTNLSMSYCYEFTFLIIPRAPTIQNFDLNLLSTRSVTRWAPS